ncbi:MAG: FAD-binding oxidoreductase [Rhodospirillaceae bacterium]|nr:FAD-binding oxidoreductase [Rhodospirillaceae bacterium]
MAERVTIVGAGIVGICTALSLLEKGAEVEVIDRDPPAEGASHGNAGVISPWTCVPQSMPGVWKNVPKWLLDPEGPVALRWGYLPKFLPWALKFLRAADETGLPAIGDAMSALNRPNVDLYRRHLDGTGHEALVGASMYVHVYRNPAEADLTQLAWRMRAERDVPLQVVGEGELHEIEPALSPGYKAAVLLKDQARALDPSAIGKALADKARAMGATFRQSAVHKVQPAGDGGWTLLTDDGELRAEKLVIAAGAWSARLLEPLGIKVPLEAERGYHLVFQNPGITVNNSIMDTQGKFVASLMNAGVRCAGTAEFAGLDTAPDYRRAQVFSNLAKRLFPEINTEDAVEWMGSRPSLPDSLPCLGEVPGHAGLFAAFGHSHYGFGMAPNTGRVVAEVVSGAMPNIDMAPYRIDRFA